MKKAVVFALILSAFAVPRATAAPDCAAPVRIEAPVDGPLQPVERVKAYRVVLQSCRRDGTERLAIRAMQLDGRDLLLTVDPQSLATQLERAACWACSETTDAAQEKTRFVDAVARASRQKGKDLPAGATWLDNAGLKQGHGDGAFVTADLCPSQRPLDRGFLQSLEQAGATTPIALSVSGLWIERHHEDFSWLRREKAEGRLAISFVNHSFHHPYRPGLPDGENYLLIPGHDRQGEILDVEQLLIANGETPSVFFRFPGLISDSAWMTALREDHLIPLGADAWLALGQRARPGSVVLVHANGNEPFGLARFQDLRQRNALPQPFRPLNEAP